MSKTHLARPLAPITACGNGIAWAEANYDPKKVDCKICMKTSFYRRELNKSGANS